MLRLFSDVHSGVDDPYFARALTLAVRGRGATWPNPVVGCVIVSDGVIVGEGYHPRAGRPHAEVFALADAGAQAAGADLYVTLEPCAHHGKTPPCADAMIAAGIARVFIGMRDPNRVAAGGVDKLRAAGITVSFADNPEPFAAINAGWLKLLASGSPRVTVKLGATLDARLSFEEGTRAAMTGPSGSAVTSRLRAASDAVCVSAATVIADDPQLTVRDSAGRRAEKQPLRVILVRQQMPPADARVLTDGLAPTLILASDLASDDALDSFSRSVEIVRWSAQGGLSSAWKALGKHGVGELLVEAGPRLLTALWESEAADEYVVVSAGGMGGLRAPALFLGEADRAGDALTPRFRPVEAGIVSDVSVTVWGAESRSHDE